MSFRTQPGPIIRRVDPVDPPLVASPYDDEFEFTTLDPKWTRVGTFDDVNQISPETTFSGTGVRWSLHGSPAGVARRSWFMMQVDPGVPSAAGALAQAIAFPNEYFIWARMSFSVNNASQVNNDANIRLTLSNLASFTSDRLMIALSETDANVCNLELSHTISGVGTIVANSNNVGGAGNTRGQAAYIVGVQRLSATYHMWALSGAGNWLHVASVNYGGIAPAFLMLEYQGGTTNFIGGFDFVRYRAGRHLP